MIDQTPHLMLRFDAHLNCLAVSSANTATFDCQPIDPVGKHIEQMGLPLAQLPEWEAILKQIFVIGAMRQAEFAVPKPSGLSYFTALFIPEHDETGVVKAVLAVVHDITTQKRREQALRASEERLRHALDAVQGNVWDWNIRTGEVFYTDQWLDSLGYTRDEVPATVDFWLGIVHPDDIPIVEAAIKAHLEGQTTFYECENRLRIKSGHYRPNIDRGKVVEWDADGKPVRMIGVDTDLTTARALASEQRTIQERLAMATDVAGVGTWEYQTQTGLLTWNRRMFAICGIEGSGPVPVERWLAIIHPDDLANTLHLRQETMGKGVHTEGEYRIIRPDGSIRHIFGIRGPLHNFEGEVIGMSGVCIDITERSRLEQRAREFAAIVDWTSSAILGKDLNGTITSWNRGAERLYGYTAEEVVGRLVEVLIPPASAHQARAILAQVARGEVVSPHETVRITKDGRPVEVMLTVSPIRDGHGRIVGASSIAQDISERKQLERALHESEERFRIIVQNANDIFAIYDEHGILRYISPAVERVTGFSQEEILTLATGEGPSREQAEIPRATQGADPVRMTSLVHPDDLPAVRDAMRRSLAQPGEATRCDFRYRTKTGDYRYLEASARSLVNRDRGYQLVVCSRDISERKALERQLQEMNAQLEQLVARRTAELEAAVVELKRAAVLKDAFLAAVSHELRTPLTGVIGIAEALLEQVAGPLNERQAHYLKAIHASGGHLLTIVKDILGYTSLLAGRIQLYPRELRWATLCNAAIRAVGERAAAQEQAVSIHVEPPGATAIGDAECITTLLEKLLDNAFKFTPAGGQVGIDVTRGGRGDSTQLVVWDTGVGIDANLLPHIFELFVQADSGLARSYGGLGLGLPYAQQIVKALAGTIEVESTPGVGSRFTVTLPDLPGGAAGASPVAPG